MVEKAEWPQIATASYCMEMRHSHEHHNDVMTTEKTVTGGG